MKTVVLFLSIIISIGGNLSAQNYSLDMIDSSLNVIEDNGVTQETVVMIGYNKQRDRGEILLRGSNPELSLNNLQIGHLGGNELGLDGDIVPYSSVSFDLGNNVSDEHWDQVVANTFVTYVPPPSAIIKSGSLSPVIGLINQLKPYRYKSVHETIQYGLPMEELEILFPEVVVSKDVDYDRNNKSFVIKRTSKGINYDAFIPILVQAIQEQQEEIEALRKRIIELEN